VLLRFSDGLLRRDRQLMFRSLPETCRTILVRQALCA
jgi:hypothetical protein